MGIVYRARQVYINRLVAVKVLAGGVFAAPDFVTRFQTEAEAVASLHHPNIVPTYEVGECEGQPFISMRFLEGGSLAERITNLKSPFSERAAVELMSKLARAVQVAHQRGILHRDIKPGNIVLDGKALCTGIATQSSASSDRNEFTGSKGSRKRHVFAGRV
jgi:serine/threonine-protein kinase